MNGTMSIGQAVTMSSREIADLVEKRHDNVKRTIETLANRGVIQLPQIEEVKNHLGQTVNEYLIGKRDSYVLVAQLSPEFTAKLVDRWQELEAAVPKTDFAAVLIDPAAMRGLLLSYTEKVLALEAEKKEMLPAVQAHERLCVGTRGSLCITDAAKDLQIQPKMLFKWLLENRWIFRRTGKATYIAYQDRLMSGLLEHKITTVEREDGSQKVIEQVRVTAKGLARIAREFKLEAA